MALDHPNYDALDCGGPTILPPSNKTIFPITKALGAGYYFGNPIPLYPRTAQGTPTLVPVVVPSVVPSKNPSKKPLYSYPTKNPLYGYPTKKPLYRYPTKKPIRQPTKKPIKKPLNQNHQNIDNSGSTDATSLSNTGLSAGAYAGIAIGGFVLVGLLIFAYFFMKKSTKVETTPVVELSEVKPAS